MSSIGTIIAAIVSGLLAFFFNRKNDQQQREEDKAAGAQEAARETDQVTKDIADKRADVAAQPDDPLDVARRLRDKAKRAAGGV